MVRILIASVAVSLGLVGSVVPVHGEIIGFEFNGTILFVSDPPPFGDSPGSRTDVKGRFFYDMDSTATDNFPACGDCRGFRQHIKNGLVVGFGDMKLSSDDYMVTVANDIPGLLPGITEDGLSVQFDSSLNPSGPITVNGVSYDAGLLQITFNSLANPFPNSSALPSSLTFADFYSGTAILNDSGSNPDPESITDVQLFSTLEDLNGLPILPGDYNLDGLVDGEDFKQWKSSFASQADRVSDGNHDGIVDAADYTVWRDRAGNGVGVGEISGIPLNTPEPSTSILFVNACLMILYPLRQVRTKQLLQ